MIWLVVGAILPSLLVAWAAAHLVRRVGPRFGLVDKPGHRKVHAKPMPTAGGLAIWMGVVAPLVAGYLLLWFLLCSGAGNGEGLIPLPKFVGPHLSGLMAKSGQLGVLLAGGTVLMLLGLVDDYRGLDWKIRLGVQTAVAASLVACDFRLTLFLDLPVLPELLSVLWIVGLVNSFNMLDNMDGLSAGVAAIAAGMLAVVMLLAGDPVTHQPQLFVGGFLLVIVGALLGFLAHNRPPARLFMGDAGSYLVGYLLAVTTISATFAGENVPPHAVLAPLCVLAVPIYDTLTVLIIRFRGGRSPFVGDKSHFSHRLVELGMTKPQAVLTIYLTTATCGLGALLLHQVQPSGACIILLLVGCVLVLVGILEIAGRGQIEPGQSETDSHEPGGQPNPREKSHDGPTT